MTIDAGGRRGDVSERDGPTPWRARVASAAGRWREVSRRPWVGRLALPLAASTLVHAGIVAVLIGSGFSVGTSRPGGYSRTEIRIDLPNPGEPPPMEPGADRAYVAPAPEVGGAAPRLSGLTTPTVGAAPTLRSSAGEWSGVGGDLSAAGARPLRRADDGGLGATFAGLGAKRAANVVYVVDASGAMVTSLRWVFEELNRSVGRLSSAQKFAVVLFRDRPDRPGAGVEVFSPTGSDPGSVMVEATATNKAALRQWLSAVRPAGRSNPLDGLRRALVFQADTVFLLSRSIRRSGGSDGTGSDSGVWGRGTAEILAELERLNPMDARGQRRVVIKAIQFLEEDPTGTMQSIGQHHGDGPGSYSVLPLEALTSR